MGDDERRGLRRAVSAFGHRDYRRFWTGAVISNIGTWMQNITVPYVLFQLTDRGLWVGLAVVAQILPSILLNPLAGSLADRFNRRNLLRVSNTIQAAAAFGLWAQWVSGVRSPVVILVLVAVGGTASMTAQPAWQAFVTDLVPAEQMLNAITLNSAQANTARAVGPALGGVLLGTLGPGWAFLLNACSFVAVLAMLTLVRPRPRTSAPPEGGVLDHFREAAAFARRHTGLRTAYALTAVVCGLGNPVFQLAAVFATRVYHTSPGRYGLLTAAYGAGAIAGAVVLGTVGADRPRGRIMPVVMTTLAVTIAAFGLVRTFWLGAALLALAGGSTLCAIATLNTSIQSGAPEGLRGRVLALWILSYTASYPLGSLVQGILADHLGPGPTVTGAGVLLCVAAAILIARPSLARSLDGAPHVTVVDPVPAGS